MPDSPAPEPAPGAASETGSERLQELFDQRRSKLDALREAGLEPYPARTSRDHSLRQRRICQSL